MASVLHDYQYSVQVKSRFDLLLSDDVNSEDPDLLMQKIQTRQQRESKSSKSASKPKTFEEDSHMKQTATGEIIPREKNTQVEHKEEKKSHTLIDSKKDEPSFNTATEDYRADDIQTQRNESWEPRGRGGHGRSGFTRSRLVRNQGQREFDRHSGSEKSGVKPLIKKDGYGTGNWGTIEDELDVTMPAEGELLEQPFEDNDEEMTEERPVLTTAMDVPVEEPKTLTLKEYKELKKASKTSIQLTSKSSRQANDGKDVFSNMVAHNKPKQIKPIVEVVNDEKIVEEPKPAIFEAKRSKSQRGRGAGNIQREAVSKVGKTPQNIDKENLQHEPLCNEPKVDSSAQHEESTPIHNASRGESKNIDRGSQRNFSRGNSRNFERGSSRNFDRSDHHETDNGVTHNESRNIYRGAPRNIERGASRNFDRGAPRSFERGAPRSFERGAPRSFERGAPRSFDRGAPRNFDRGAFRTFERGAPRNFDRGAPRNFDRGFPRNFDRGASQNFARGVPRNFERRVSHNFDRDDAKDPELNSEIHVEDDRHLENGSGVTKDQSMPADHQAEVSDRSSFRGRGNFGRGRATGGRPPFRSRGRFRGSYDNSAMEGSYRKVVQPPSMDSDFDFPSLN